DHAVPRRAVAALAVVGQHFGPLSRVVNVITKGVGHGRDVVPEGVSGQLDAVGQSRAKVTHEGEAILPRPLTDEVGQDQLRVAVHEGLHHLCSTLRGELVHTDYYA